MAESKTSRKRLEAFERKLRALELRKGGATFEQIGKTLDVSTATAYSYVMEALKETLREPADELRTLELERIDRLALALWPRAVGERESVDGRIVVHPADLRAVDRVVKLMERRAALLGLDAPQKLEQSGSNGGPISLNFIERSDGPQ
jgi:hypothetical protein